MIVTETTIDVPGGRVWAGIHGGGQAGIPLLVVHGGPGAPHDYLEPLAELADERPVIFYDQLGCGRSGRPDDCSLWTLERAIQELSVVRSTLGLERVHLLGQSWGALLSAGYVLRQGQSGVASLVLSGPLLSAPRWIADQRRLLSAMSPDVRQAVADAESSGDFDTSAYQAAMQSYYQRHLCRMDPWPDCLNRTFANMGLNVYLAMWGPSEFTTTGNLKDVDLVPDLVNLSLPTLITCGRHDEVMPETAALYQREIPGARLAIFEEASHSHHLECAEQYLVALRTFLAETEKVE